MVELINLIRGPHKHRYSDFGVELERAEEYFKTLVASCEVLEGRRFLQINVQSCAELLAVGSHNSGAQVTDQ